ncbi:MAG: hypothetical protein BJ554DRAFT_6216, partial [Olpidium bornovanus]
VCAFFSFWFELTGSGILQICRLRRVQAASSICKMRDSLRSAIEWLCEAEPDAGAAGGCRGVQRENDPRLVMAVLLGTTITTPKATFVVHFPPVRRRPSSELTGGDQRALDAAEKKRVEAVARLRKQALREVVTIWGAAPPIWWAGTPTVLIFALEIPAPTRLHLLLRTPRKGNAPPEFYPKPRVKVGEFTTLGGAERAPSGRKRQRVETLFLGGLSPETERHNSSGRGRDRNEEMNKTSTEESIRLSHFDFTVIQNDPAAPGIKCSGAVFEAGGGGAGGGQGGGGRGPLYAPSA